MTMALWVSVLGAILKEFMGIYLDTQGSGEGNMLTEGGNKKEKLKEKKKKTQSK